MSARLECGRCGSTPVSHRVRSDQMNLVVCAQCAVQAYRVQDEMRHGEGCVVCEPLTPQEMRHFNCWKEVG